MNFSFSRLGQHGRLANQLFQIMGTIGMSQLYSKRVQTIAGPVVAEKVLALFPEWQYEQYFSTMLNYGPVAGPVVKEEHFHHYDWQLGESCDLLGYMQSEKYFPDYNPFVFKQTYLGYITAKANFITTPFAPSSIFIHVRRGDYVGNQHYHQLPITYYLGALEKFYPGWYDERMLVIASDDIPYCRVHFAGVKNIFFAEGFNEIETMALGSLCDDFILSNSSYSWWCAWLAERRDPDVQVVHPGHLFAGPSLRRNDTKDFWPVRWTEYKREDGYKLPLQDMTFTIPVFHDHKDRKQNLDLCVCMLQTAFYTNIIVGEQGSKSFGYMEQWTQYRWFGYKHFHRTKMLNQMAEMADSPWVANWDCDVFIAPIQIYIAVMLLRSGAAHMVFPYDGRFARLPRVPWFGELQRALDLGVVKDTEPKGTRGKPVPENSVGGAVFFNKRKFIEGGMENENMISFGPEDCERNDRFTMLGYLIARVGGCLYHIDHFIGPNSSKGNPFFRANHKELDKVRAMDAAQLRAYITTWPWRPAGATEEEVVHVFEQMVKWAAGVTGKKYAVIEN